MAQSIAIRHARIFDLLGVLFTASPTPGTFAFQIDDVRFI